MPASTLEILSKKWEDEENLFSEIVLSAKDANLYFSFHNNELVLRIEPTSDRFLSFEIRTEKTVAWYLEKYPMAKNESEDRLPYIKFLEGVKYHSIALANNYLDGILVWRFAHAYLDRNRSHLILVNGDQAFSVNQLPEEYEKGWCFSS